MKVVFMGTPDFAVQIVDALYKAGHEILLVVTQPDKPKGRGEQMQYPDAKKWAIEKNIPVFQPVKIKTPEAVAELAKYPADIFVVAAFGQILSKEILDMPPFGCVNVHASLLPKYRGAAPIQWSILNGDVITGVTTMQMGVGLDDGDILLKRQTIIGEQETGGELFDRLALLGGELIVETLDGLEKGTITPIPQDETEATHVGMIHKSLGKLDFTKTAEELARYVRGLNPWPSAYTTLDGKVLKIWKAHVDIACPGTIFLDSYGEGHVVATSDKGIWVATSDGFLVLEEVQLEGKKRMDVADFLRGRAIEIGTKLGEVKQ